jgi:hypothetical protein
MQSLPKEINLLHESQNMKANAALGLSPEIFQASFD